MTATPSPWARRLHDLLSGRRPPDVYRLVTTTRADKVANAARAEGWTTWILTGEPTTKAGLLVAAATAMEFPAWFGHNWDALADCLTEVATEAPGGLLVWPDAGALAAAAPDEWAVALDVLRRAVAFHADHDWTFAVVCLGERAPTELPRL